MNAPRMHHEYTTEWLLIGYEYAADSPLIGPKYAAEYIAEIYLILLYSYRFITTKQCQL